MPDLTQELLASVQIYAVAREGGILNREQLEALLALSKVRTTSVNPRAFQAVVESHLRALNGR